MNNFVYYVAIFVGVIFLFTSLYVYIQKKNSDSVPNSIVYSGVLLLSLSVVGSIKFGDFEWNLRQATNYIQAANQRKINELDVEIKNLKELLANYESTTENPSPDNKISKRDYVRILFRNANTPYEDIQNNLIEGGINAVVIPTDFSELGLSKFFISKSKAHIRYKEGYKAVAHKVAKAIKQITGLDAKFDKSRSESPKTGDVDVWLF
jgi:hypothetical protein